ncbi:MAG: ABC transporter permease [Spirochaetaceae bacterium]|nr:MAG: ABC transporter permease [Spirochaetaceae bacterium]
MVRIRNYFLTTRYAAPLAILVVLVVFLAIFTPQRNFIRARNIQNLLALGPEFTIIVLGAGMLMIAGEFDLSVGSALAFTGFVFTWLLGSGVNPLLAMVLTVATGLVIGLINGVITVKAKILSFITTLGAMMLWRGLTLILTRGAQLPVRLGEHVLFTTVLTGRILGYFPMPAVWFIILALILGVILHRNRYGNWIYATGNQPMAARAMCINTDMVKIISFMTLSGLVAFAAVIQTVRVAAFSSRIGTDWELKVIAACVVGGTSLFGGRGSMGGIFCGALIVIIIENALTVARLPYEWTFMVYGIVIMFSALLDLFIESRRLKLT